MKFLDGEAITQSLRDGTYQLDHLQLDYICLNENSINNLSKFMIKQQNLKFFKIQHAAEKYTDAYQCIEDTPKKLPDKALSDFLSSLSRCASASLEVLSLHNLQINAQGTAQILNQLICQQAIHLKTLTLHNMIKKQKH